MGDAIDVAALYVDDGDEVHFACSNDVNALTRSASQRREDGAILIDVTCGR
jgi:hypothetical protein